jgi:hypothetical protein
MSLGRLSVLKSPQFLNLGAGADDNALKNCLRMATDIIERAIGHKVQLTTNTNEFFTGRGAKFYYPRNWPVNVVTQITFADSGQIIDPTTYEIRNGRAVWVLYPNAWQIGLLTANAYDAYKGGWVNGLGYKITYQSGFNNNNWNVILYAATWPVPYNMEYATCELAAQIWLEGKAGGARAGISAINRGAEGAGYIRYEHGLPDSVKRVVNEYRDFPI